MIPFEEKVNIEVRPDPVNVTLFANNNNITGFDEVKISSIEAGSGIIFDATSTSVDRGVRIQTAEWDFGNGERAIDTGGIGLHQQTYTR